MNRQKMVTGTQSSSLRPEARNEKRKIWKKRGGLKIQLTENVEQTYLSFRINHNYETK